MQNDFINWCKKEKFNILLVLFSATIPVIGTGLFQLWPDHTSCPGRSLFQPSRESGGFLLANRSFNYGVQALFIFITLYVLIRNRRKTNQELAASCSIKQYIAKYCRIKIYNHTTLDSTFEVVKGTVNQFYLAWMAIWLIWLVYYLGNFLFVLDKNPNTTIHQIVFKQVFDFLSSSVLLIIYIILNNVTVNLKQRISNNAGYMYGILIWVLLLTVFLVGLSFEIFEGKSHSSSYYYVSLLLSAFSAISFVLVLGKINSNFLQIPRIFMFGMYAYAIIQSYIPFAYCKEAGFPHEMESASMFLSAFIPYATFMGKIFVMLTLCWIVYRKRFIFFVIHKSISLDETPALLNELNRDNVDF